MKTLLQSVLLILAVFTVNLSAQSQLTTLKAKVYGNCNHCKENIENALHDIDGVSSANWDKKSKMLTVDYDAKKVDQKVIKNAVTAAGYDFEDQKASDESYSKLAKCCRYRAKSE